MTERSDIADVVKAIQQEVTTIVRGEIALAAEDIKAETAKAGRIAGLVGGAGYLMVSAIAILFGAFGFAWAVGFSVWFACAPLPALFWGFLVNGVVILAVAALMMWLAKRSPQPQPPVAIAERAKDQAEFVRHSISQAVEDVGNPKRNRERTPVPDDESLS